MSAKVVVACGHGIATSHMVAQKVAKLLAAEGVEANVVAVDMDSLAAQLKDADAYIPVVKTEEELDVPTFNGVAFVTGMGQDEELKRLIEAIRDK
ncbi:PTS sugar transporter subunit IIB [uncultured Olsenella sp.]|uniref:PTS sugar transporter subunit IIB n=1 Tax=uncultured Olsenella sp. TaxID=190764 RepID=UPI0026DC5753|nr:PTS sugar transporter subunit IIB [uncultured Olsenella sp.]